MAKEKGLEAYEAAVILAVGRLGVGAEEKVFANGDRMVRFELEGEDLEFWYRLNA